MNSGDNPADDQMQKRDFDINALLAYEDPREIPCYSVAEAAHYLNIPKATLRSWVLGTTYAGSGGKKIEFHRVIDLPRRDSNLLSYFNLAEAHVLRALRIKHRVRLQNIRRALRYVKRKFGWQRPLIEQGFKTDGVALFVQHLGMHIDASATGQTVMVELIDAHLERLEWEDNLVACLYPFTRPNGIHSPKSVMIDPRFSFGRPILRESRIETAIVAGRYKAGDSIVALAKDYACPRLEIEEAIRCELGFNAAA